MVFFDGNKKERVMRIELTYAAWKAAVLPLNYTRILIRDGVPERNRTADPLIKSQLLYHLSYRDIGGKNGWGSWIRTSECQSQSLVPYRLAMPQSLPEYIQASEDADLERWWRRVVSNHRTQREQIYSLPRLATSLRLHMVPTIGIEPTTY